MSSELSDTLLSGRALVFRPPARPALVSHRPPGNGTSLAVPRVRCTVQLPDRIPSLFAPMSELAELLSHQPLPGGVLLRGLPVADGREDHLIRQVMALANSDSASSRCLVFGAEQGAAGTVAVIGLCDADVARLTAQLRLCINAIEPALDVRVVTAVVTGKTVAALVIDNSSNPPYVAGPASPGDLRAGECWLFDEQGLRPAARADLDNMYATRRQRQQQIVLIGIGDDPRNEILEVQVPDNSKLPSRVATLKLSAAVKAQAIAAAIVGRDDTAMARLAHLRIFGADEPFRQDGPTTLKRALKEVPDEYREADLYYRFEERAVRMNLSVMNNCAEVLRSAILDLTFPVVAGLEFATQLCGPSGQSSNMKRAYPEVRQEKDCIRVRASLGDLAPGSTTRAFPAALRLAVDRSLVGQKIALRYILDAEGLLAPRQGRLRIKLRA